MVVSGKFSVSVHKIIKSLVRGAGVTCKIIVGETEHIFRLEETQCGAPYLLVYSVEDYYGQPRTWKWPIVDRPSNLPGTDAIRYYLSLGGTLVQCLHIRNFVSGQFFYIRHQYRHIYASQNYSQRQKRLKFHDYGEKINDLIFSKKKLRMTYRGKPTRTAKRLNRYRGLVEHYEGLADQQLMQLIAGKYSI